MLRPYLKIWDWDLILGRVVKVILTPGVCSPWIEQKTLINGGLDFLVMWRVVCEITLFGKWFLNL